MIIGGFPVAMREIHHLARGWWRMASLREDPAARDARLHFLYFSYAPDFASFRLSLLTLARAIPKQILGGIHLAEDQKAPFSPSQIEALRQLAPLLHVMPVHDFEWGSARSTHAELQIFKQVCERMPDRRDLLVKIDSDVLLLPNHKWLKLLRSGADAIGDGHYLQHRYAQGGLYMMRREVVHSVFRSTTLRDVQAVAKRLSSVGEDMHISQMLADAGQPFFLTRMMLFPDEYRPLQSIRGPTKQEFLAFHCHKDKVNMSSLCGRFGLLDDQGLV